jgi:hypothetical protein
VSDFGIDFTALLLSAYGYPARYLQRFPPVSATHQSAGEQELKQCIFNYAERSFIFA